MKHRATLAIYLLSVSLLINLSCKKEISCEGCINGNKLPIAIAGPDQVITLPTDSISLDGSASKDPDGMISEWLWTKIAGPASFNIANASSAKTVVKNLIEGIYQFELKVTDAGGLFSKDTMNVIVETTTPDLQANWEIIITLPIDSVFIADYYRDDEGTHVVKISGSDQGIIAEGGWVKDLVPGQYLFQRYWRDGTAAEIVKVTVLDDPNEYNTITYKNLIWEYNYGLDPGGNSPHLYLTRPAWPGTINPAIEVSLQMDFLNNGEWFKVPSSTAGYEFSLDCHGWNNLCFTFFVIKVSPENSSWDLKKGNLKIKIL